MRQQIDSIEIDFHQLIEYSINSIFLVDQRGNIHYCNKACLELLSMSSSESILLKNIDEFIYSDFQSIFQEQLTMVLKKKEPIKRIEIKMKNGNGKIIEAEVKAVPFYLGHQVLAQLIIQDTTIYKKTEKLLKSKEKLSSLGLIAAGIAHEVKNPLTAVKGFLQLIQEDISHPYFSTMEVELEKALGTLHNLLQVSKPDLEEESLVPINVGKELSSLLLLFQEKSYKVEVKTDIRDSGKIVIGKKNLFLKAFFNLIKNAFEAIQDEGTLTIEHYFDNGIVHVKVSDTGIGIPENKLSIMGTPFYSTKEEGTGLGLTQVYTTILEHGGTVSVQSTVGAGTMFHIQLPVKEKD